MGPWSAIFCYPDIHLSLSIQSGGNSGFGFNVPIVFSDIVRMLRNFEYVKFILIGSNTVIEIFIVKYQT